MKSTILFILIFTFNLFSQNFPDWAKGVVWYQIFPERFANSDKKNDPAADKVFINNRRAPNGWKVTSWTSNWFEPSPWEKDSEGKIRDIYDRRYGGDIQGIIDNLDYLEELGVGAIYLNPVFDAVSLHKYDGSTYHHIDVNFGPDPVGDQKIMDSETPDDPSTWKWTKADQLFLKLIEEVHSRNMRMVIDGVFNHTGMQFWAFKDIVKNGEKSPYKDWFRINSFDNPSTEANEFDYKGWWNIKSLPEINRTSTDLHPMPKEYVFNSTRRWMDPNGDGKTEDGIDGWRLDVAREVPLGFWNDWSKLVKSINSKSIIIGELWELSPDFISANGPFDALMNYSFAYAVDSLFIQKNITIADFINKLAVIDSTYPPGNLDILQNLMDSHDTERLSSRIYNPGRAFDRDAGDNNTDYNPGKPNEKSFQLMRLVAAFMMTYPGAPMVYYGDEIGMWGADDPHDRKPMVSDNLKYDDEVITASSRFSKGHGTYKVEQDKDLLAYYKNLIALRNGSEALKTGKTRFIYSSEEKKSFIFERMSSSERILIAFNLGEAEDVITLPDLVDASEYTDIISGDKRKMENKFEINLPPGSFRILNIK